MTEAVTLTRMRDEMKAAMKARASDRVGTLRFLIASFHNKEIELRRNLTDDDILTVLTTEAKKRREAAHAFQEGGRMELARKEEAELAVIQDYLPEQLSDEEVAGIVDEVIAATGASSKADMGKVMGGVMPKVKGRFDGAKVKGIVMGKLG